MGNLFSRIELGSLHFSAQGFGWVSWKPEFVRPLPFGGFTPVIVVEDKELGIPILEKDLQGDILYRETIVITMITPRTKVLVGDRAGGGLPCGFLW